MKLLQLELVLPNRREAIRISGMAVRRADSNDGQQRVSGCGVRFLVVDGDAKDAWTRFIIELERRPQDAVPRSPSGSTPSAGQRRTVRADAPELRVTIADPIELRGLTDDVLAGRELMIETPMQVPLRCEVWVTFVSPADRRAVSVSGAVRGVYADDDVRGVAVRLRLTDADRRAIAELADCEDERSKPPPNVFGFKGNSEVVARPSFESIFE